MKLPNGRFANIQHVKEYIKDARITVLESELASKTLEAEMYQRAYLATVRRLVNLEREKDLHKSKT